MERVFYVSSSKIRGKRTTITGKDHKLSMGVHCVFTETIAHLALADISNPIPTLFLDANFNCAQAQAI